jgi:hypothetical protein
MMKKQLIQVRSKQTGKPVNIIKRVIRFESCGNFNPGFARYNGRQFLVKSDQGDLSDPFRANETYLTSLFIEE